MTRAIYWRRRGYSSDTARAVAALLRATDGLRGAALRSAVRRWARREVGR